MTRNEAYDQLPADAEWSCSFGYPGEPGFVEYYRDPKGNRYNIAVDAYRAGWSFNRI
jgi:hypothetical protein